MKPLFAVIAVGAAAIALPAGVAEARAGHHHYSSHRQHPKYAHVARHRYAPHSAYAVAPPPYGYGYAYGYGAPAYGNPSQEPLGSGEFNPYVNYYGPGSIVLNATERARREPGVTLELAPDALETATGGPAGGVPGFDGI